MDNVTHAIFLAFAMFSLVIGLSYGLYLLTNLNSVATDLINSNDATSDYSTVSFEENLTGTSNQIGQIRSKRLVSLDNVISAIYNYRKENYSVEIYTADGDSDEKLYQIFDLTVEGFLGNGTGEENKAYIQQYGNIILGDVTDITSYAPWMNKTDDDLQSRIDFFVNSKKGYINGQLVNYSSKGLKQLESRSQIEEQFIQYTYDGETISDSYGEDVETITGSTKAHTKIVIRYIFR